MQAHKGRLTVIQSVYHYQEGQSPTCVDSGYYQWLDSGEQPYIRHQLLNDPAWQFLETGWLKEVSEVVLSVDGKVSTGEVEISLVADAAFPEAQIVLGVGRSARFCPGSVGNVLVRCPKGSARLIVNLFPK